jgi:electron transport complex protein RnfB
MDEKNNQYNRRDFLRHGVWGACAAGVAGAGAILASKSRGRKYVWQVDPHKCTACGNCATFCVMQESAVKCVHAYAICGYCDLCTGYYRPEPKELNTAAENQLCPRGAIKRTYVEDPYFEYTIDETKCNGCGKCVMGCTSFGNGSLFLQIRHDRCVECNECAIVAACPVNAIVRVPADEPYLLKDRR